MVVRAFRNATGLQVEVSVPDILTIASPGVSGLYPPGEALKLLLAGNAYEYSSVKVEGGSGPGRDLTSTNLGVVPSLFAGELPILKHDRLAYGVYELPVDW